MPLTLIQTILGLSFVLIWAFIGSMILRDRQLAIRNELDHQADQKAAVRRTPHPQPARQQNANPGEPARRRRGASAA